MQDVFSQFCYRVRLEWGRRGAQMAAERGDILVVVDTLRFSTTVATAVRHGAIVIPCLDGEDPSTLAAKWDAEPTFHHRDPPGTGRYSLSPDTFFRCEPGAKVVLPSLNGSHCARYADRLPHIFVGALVNAQAVAAAVSRTSEVTGLAVTVLACGERWTTPSEDGDLRFAIEDYLGAGAILSYIDLELSPEASLCKAAFVSQKERLESLLWECGSGLELRERGQRADVLHAAQLNLYDAVPAMQNGAIKAFETS
jgi:2-phosphosulfolactate phosphatase